jgi:hypothetical protein
LAIATIVVVGASTLAVLAASRAHKPWSRGPHHRWASAAIAATLVVLVAAVALPAASRARRRR